MIKKILIALFFVPFISFGQKQDTIPVVMLVSDTSRIVNIGWANFQIDTAATRKYTDTTKSLYRGLIGKWHRDTTYSEPNHSTYWQFGYEVLSKVETDDWIVDLSGHGQYRYYWELFCYLDDKKQPIKKSIIVWQTKQVKDLQEQINNR